MNSKSDNKPTSFTDAMDPTRILVPVELKGKRVSCKVYFKGAGGSLNYSGEVELSAHLFDQTDRRNAFVGFIPTSEAEARASAEKSRNRRDNREERREHRTSSRERD